MEGKVVGFWRLDKALARWWENCLDQRKGRKKRGKMVIKYSSYAVDANAPKNVPRPYNSWWGKVSEYVFGV